LIHKVIKTPRQEIKRMRTYCLRYNLFYFNKLTIYEHQLIVNNYFTYPAVSNLTPGPIVDVTEMLRKYVPLEDCGFAFTIVSIIASMFSTNFSLSKEIFPTGTCKLAALSTRYSTLPALISSTAFSTSKVTVPVLGFGIKPLGPNTRPNFPTSAIMSGVATITSKSNQPSLIF